jgi:ribosomal-protein-alanine N-acetyltransferase
VTFFACLPLTPALLTPALALDQRCLGGLWTREGYQRELDSPNSDLLILASAPTADLTTLPPSALTLIGLGCLWAILDEAHITNLAIDPDYQRHRLGQWLLLQLLHSARRRQLSHATLEVRISNQAAQKLYQKLDFKVAGQRKRYYQDDETALVLWRSGLQHPDFSRRLTQLSQECEAHFQAQNWQWMPLNHPLGAGPVSI